MTIRRILSRWAYQSVLAAAMREILPAGHETILQRILRIPRKPRNAGDSEEALITVLGLADFKLSGNEGDTLPLVNDEGDRQTAALV